MENSRNRDYVDINTKKDGQGRPHQEDTWIRNEGCEEVKQSSLGEIQVRAQSNIKK